MNLPQNNKPTLRDLFDSKKLDQPKDEFWDNFQDQVRCKTLSSVVTEKNSSSIGKYIYMVGSFLTLTAMIFFIDYDFSSDPSLKTKLPNSESLTFKSVEPLEVYLKESLNEDLNLYSSIENESEFLYKHDKSLFVEQNFKISSLESIFQHRVLKPSVEHSDDSTRQFTF